MVKYNVKYNNSRKKEAVSLRDMPSGFANLDAQILALYIPWSGMYLKVISEIATQKKS